MCVVLRLVPFTYADTPTQTIPPAYSHPQLCAALDSQCLPAGQPALLHAHVSFDTQACGRWVLLTPSNMICGAPPLRARSLRNSRCPAGAIAGAQDSVQQHHQRGAKSLLQAERLAASRGLPQLRGAQITKGATPGRLLFICDELVSTDMIWRDLAWRNFMGTCLKACLLSWLSWFCCWLLPPRLYFHLDSIPRGIESRSAQSGKRGEIGT